MEKVNHPSHYGGADNPYEAIKVIEAWNLNFNLGNTIKYISRHDKKGRQSLDDKRSMQQCAVDDLKKAMWYLNREIENLEGRKEI